MFLTLSPAISTAVLIEVMAPRIDTAVRCSRLRHMEREDAAQEAAIALLAHHAALGSMPMDDWLALAHTRMTRAIARAEAAASGISTDVRADTLRLLAQHEDAAAAHRALEAMPASGPGQRRISPATFLVAVSMLLVTDLDAEAEVLLRGVWGQEVDPIAAVDDADELAWVWGLLTDEQTQLVRAAFRFQDPGTRSALEAAGVDADADGPLDMTELARAMGLGSRQTAMRRLREVLATLRAALD